MNIIALRHGQAEHNKQFKLNESSPPISNLTSRGTQQVNQLRESLKNEGIDIIYTSELARAQQTAAIINRDLKVPINIDSRLNEIRTGLQGKNVLQWIVRLGLAKDKENYRFNGGESPKDVQIRLLNFLNDLKTKPYKNVLIVSHQQTLQILASILQGKPLKSALRRPVGHTHILRFKV